MKSSFLSMLDTTQAFYTMFWVFTKQNF